MFKLDFMVLDFLKKILTDRSTQFTILIGVFLLTCALEKKVKK
ncbi:hypothetical protein [Clostridium cochlearium]|nr:hypothetical protein [Clostridium cochlearium]